ncbi:MAG TPA: SDR family NAD(P)-dependent oxidoreductase [Acidimicrobiales bacterium]|nr:SDR family NAD(P)-dependent oxidoreductase [Acidimicrobiales bacterium]
MSPLAQPGAPDHERGTEPEYVTPGRFTAKTALVTGAGSGIGRATARRLAAEGAAVGCLDVAEDHLATVVDEINDAGGPGRAVGYRCDVTDEDSVGGTVARAADELGPATVVCNVAGVGGFAHATEQSLEGWNRTIAVNLTGTFLVCRAALPTLLELGGSITNVVSTAGLIGQPYSAAYCASKGGVALLTRALAVEYLGKGVRVNGVAPGGVDTPMLWGFGIPEGIEAKALKRIMTPMGYCTPAEVASAIAYLASDEAGYVSGAILSVDGGVST